MRKGRFAAVVFALGAGAVIAAAPAVASDDESDSAGATVAASVAEPSEDEGSDSDTSVDTVDADEADDADLEDVVEPEEVDEVEAQADEVEDIAEVEVEEIEVTDDELDEGDDVITLEDAPEVVEASEVPAAPKAVPGSDPGPGTLLYINPFGGSMDPHKFLDGMFVDPGTKVVNVPYPNTLFDSVSNDNANIAVANLTEALANNQGTTEAPTKVIGHSAGGQMIYK